MLVHVHVHVHVLMVSCLSALLWLSCDSLALNYHGSLVARGSSGRSVVRLRDSPDLNYHVLVVVVPCRSVAFQLPRDYLSP